MSAAPASRVDSRLRLLALGVVAVHVALVWALPHFPSQDGPVHVESALAAHTVASDPGSELAAYFRARGGLDTNRFVAGFLRALFALGLAPATAGKVVASLWFLVLPGAAWIAMRAMRLSGELGARADLGVALTVPVLGSRLVSLGFLNLLFGIALFPLVVVVFLRAMRMPDRWRVLTLAALLLATYLVHVFAAAMAVGVLLAVALAQALASAARDASERASPRWSGLAVLGAALLPLLPFALDFLGEQAVAGRVYHGFGWRLRQWLLL